MHNLLIYGGTFDPIHNGHMGVARHVQKHFNFDRFIFLPCKTPVLKGKTYATAKQRIEMLQLALNEQISLHFEINTSEIDRLSPSYMVDTLADFRRQYTKVAINLLLGIDSFRQLPQWYEWSQLIELANLLVIARPEKKKRPLPLAMQTLVDCSSTNDQSQLFKKEHGVIYFYNAGHYAIASSDIRARMIKGETLQNYLPESVFDYIQTNKLYR